MLLYSKLLDDVKQKLPPEWRPLLDPLFNELHKKDIFIWLTFFIACAAFTLSILNFIDSFIQAEDQLSASLTSTGKYREENPGMASSSSLQEELLEL